MSPTSPHTLAPAVPRRARRRPAGPPFELVVERHGAALLRFCSARLGPDRGEDAFQETLLAALRHYDELKDPAAAGGWLFAIAYRKVVDAARSRPRESPMGEEIDEHTVGDGEPGPGSGIWTRVAALPPKQREAIGLRFLGDLSHAEVGQAMGTTEEAARRNVFEGLKRLRKDLADGPDGH